MPVWTNIPGQFGTWRTRAQTFPRWGVSLLMLAALPGLLVALAGGLLLAVSLAAILILVLPTYRLITWVSGTRRSEEADFIPEPSPGAKPVTVRVIQ